MKNKLKLADLKVSSFISSPSAVRGGNVTAYEPIMTPPQKATEDTCLCQPTFWETCPDPC